MRVFKHDPVGLLGGERDESWPYIGLNVYRVDVVALVEIPR